MKKTREQLLSELAEMRQRIAELEVSEARYRQIEDALLESENRFRSIAETASDAIIIFDSDENIFFWNEAAKTIFGYSVGETQGEILDSIMARQSSQMFQAAMQEMIATGKSDLIGKTIEVNGIRKDGSELPVELSLASWKAKDEAYFTIIARDITERKQAEKALKEAYAEVEERVEERTAKLQKEIAERKRVEKALQEHATQLEALREVGLELTAQLDLDTLLHSIVSRAAELLEATSGGLYLYRPEQDILEWIVSVSVHPIPTGISLRLGEGLSGKVLETGKPLIVGNYGEWEGRAAVWEDIADVSVVGVPIRWGEEFLGVLNVAVDVPNSFSEDDAELLRLFATQAAIAIHNARLYRQAQQEIVDRKRVEDALRESEGRLELAIAGSNGGEWYYVLDPDDALRTLPEEVYISPRLKSFIGYEDDEFPNSVTAWENRVHPKDLPVMRERSRDHREGRTDVYEVEYRIRHKDGSIRWLQTRGKVQRDEQGRPIRFAGIDWDVTERKQVEEALRESEEKYRDLVENISDVIYTVDAEGVITYISPAVESFIEYSPSEVIGHHLEEFVHPEDLVRLGESYQNILSGQTATSEYRAVTKSGKVRWMHTSSQPVFEKGRIVGVRGALADITERKRAEEALRESVVLLNESQAIGHIGSWKLDLIANRLTWSDEVYRIFGMRPQEFEATYEAFLKAVHPDDRAAVDAAYSRSLREGRDVYEIEHRILHRDSGEVRVVHEKCRHVKDASGQIVRSVGMVQDITERKQAEETLERRNRELALLNQIGQTFAGTLDLDLVFVTVLEEVRRLLNVTACSIWLVYPETDELVCQQAIGPQSEIVRGWRLMIGEGLGGWVARSGESLIVSDTRTDARHFKNVDQQTGIEMRAILSVPLRIKQNVIGVLQVMDTEVDRFRSTDLTLVESLAASAAIAIENARLIEALHQHAAELEARNEELDAFAHTVAHDLKNPVGLIVGFANVLEQDCFTMPRERLQEYLGTIARNGHKVNNIIDELLLLAGVRQMEVSMTSLDMVRIVVEAQERLAHLIEEYQAEIILPDASAWPEVLGYAPWVEEVWVNYLSNTLKYGGRPPRVELGATAQPDGMVRFWIQDNGPGLTVEEQSRLFTPFTQLDQVRAEGKGHGLGLSIVRRIVEKLKGQVGVESKTDVGSTFWFTLPAS